MPLNSTAVAVIRQQISCHGTHVFSYRSERLRTINVDSWQQAWARTGIKELR